MVTTIKVDFNDLVQYFKDKTGLEPTREQLSVLHDLSDFGATDQIIACGKGFSKSLLCALFALYCADKLGLLVLFISHQSRILDLLDSFFRKDPSLIERLRVKGDSRYFPTERGIVFKDSIGEVIVRLDTSGQLTGIHVDLVIADECQDIDNNLLINTIEPCASGGNYGLSRLIIVGTPSNPQSEFVRIYEDTLKRIQRKKSDKWVLSHYGSDTCWWMKTRIEKLKESMSPDDYKSIILAQIPLPSEISPYKKLLKKSVKDISAAPLNKPENYRIGGLDLGFGKTNPCGLVIREANRKSVKSKVIYTQLLNPEMQKLTALINEWRPEILVVDEQPDALSVQVKTYVQPTCPKTRFVYVRQQGKKDNMIAQLAEMMSGGLVSGASLIIPSEFKQLIRELQHYDKEKDRNRNLADALILSCYKSEETNPEPPKPEFRMINIYDGKIAFDSKKLSVSNVKPRCWWKDQLIGTDLLKTNHCAPYGRKCRHYNQCYPEEKTNE